LITTNGQERQEHGPPATSCPTARLPHRTRLWFLREEVDSPDATARKILEAAKRATALELTQDRYWRAFYRDPADCGRPRSNLRALECKNMRYQAWGYFRRDWANKLASGWLPPELE